MRLSASFALVMTSILVSSCATVESRSLDVTHRTADVKAGQQIQITAGDSNASIGDDWRLVAVTPTSSLTGIRRYAVNTPSCPSNYTGCSDGTMKFSARLSSSAPVGEKISFQVKNCFRGDCSHTEGMVRYTLHVSG